MNCKPGDLAIIIRASARVPHALGLIVQVLDSDTPRYYGTTMGVEGEQPTWWCRFARPVRNAEGRVSLEFAVPDFALRPIRDPGDDAVDETLREREVTA